MPSACMKNFRFLLTDVRSVRRIVAFSVTAVRLHFIGHKGFKPSGQVLQIQNLFYTPRMRLPALGTGVDQKLVFRLSTDALAINLVTTAL